MTDRVDVNSAAAPLPPTPGFSTARRRLHLVALDLLADRGYHGVSVRDITDALGHRPGAFYAHAASKQELLAELVRIGLTLHRDRLRTAVLDAGADPVDQMRALVRAHVRVHLDFPALARVVDREVRALDAAHRATADALAGETLLTLREVIDRGRARGVFGEVDDYLASQAIGAMGVAVAEWWTPDAPRTPDQVVDGYADFALAMLRPRTDGDVRPIRRRRPDAR